MNNCKANLSSSESMHNSFPHNLQGADTEIMIVEESYAVCEVREVEVLSTYNICKQSET